MQKNSRIQIVDVLRGWALLGVVICNFTYFAYSMNGTLNGNVMVNTVLQEVESYLFSAKGWTLLHVLFGFGFGVFLEHNNNDSIGILRFVKRMLYLLGFAFINTIFYEGDILRDYAILGLFLLPFYKLSSKKILIISIIMFLALPFVAAFVNNIPAPDMMISREYLATLYHSYDLWDVIKYNLTASYYEEIINPGYLYTAHYVMFFCMLIGLLFQKNRVFENLELYSKIIKATLIISLLLTIVLTLGFVISIQKQANYLSYFEFHYWNVLCTMVFTSSCICILHINSKCRILFHAFGLVGRMTLTNYIMQNVISFFIFKGVGLRLFDTLPFYFYFVFAIVLYVFQVLFSIWWLNRFNYGPIEWLWRKLSNTKVYFNNNISKNNGLRC